MEPYDALFSASINILSIYIMVRLLKLFLPVKITKSSVTLPIYIGIWFSNWCIYYFFGMPNLTTFSLLAGLMLAAITIFDGSVPKKIMAVIISVASGTISENIVWKLSAALLPQTKNEAVECMCAVILNFLIVLVIERYISPDRYAILPRGGYFNILLISVGSVILSEIIILQDDPGNSAMIGLSIICLINVGTYYIYEKISESWNNRLKNAEMEQQIRMYANQFDIINQTRQNIQSFRHDMKNHLSLLNIFLTNNEHEKAADYIKSLNEVLENEREYVKTGNIEIDSILNYKLEQAERFIGCKTDIQIDVPDQSFMSGFDLNILLGNLLDNALEAVSKADDKFLDIRIRYTKDILYISIYNTFDGNISIKDNRLSSTKKNIGNHGVGLENIKKIVEKYEGTINIEHNNHLFKADLILFPETAKI